MSPAEQIGLRVTQRRAHPCLCYTCFSNGADVRLKRSSRTEYDRVTQIAGSYAAATVIVDVPDQDELHAARNLVSSFLSALAQACVVIERIANVQL